MKTKIKTNDIILLLSAILSFFCLVFIIYRVNTDPEAALNIDKSRFGILDYIMGAGHLIVLLFHVYAIIFIFMHFRHFKELRLFKTGLLIIGIISLFSIGVEKIMIDEIAREYRAGMEISEISILTIAYILNIIFSLLIFFFVLRTFSLRKDYYPEVKSVEEEIFTIAQYMGIISGIMGLSMIFSLTRKDIPADKLAFYIPFFILFLVPYALAVLYWLSLKLREKISSWYDEKQLHDIMKASLTTLLLSFPGLALFL
ncbi:MAG: hypothetical protein IQL11_09205, partial [Bacteroidales bacterium]|nr:hypothetical protein [Bacteroidales bacterium]